MERSRGVRARQVGVVPDPLVPEGADYADAFEIVTADADERSAEEFARAVLDGAPLAAYWTVWLVHNHVLRFKLGPRRSPEHVLGWTVTHNEPDAFRIEASGPLIEAVIVGRGWDDRRRVTTAVYFRQRFLARMLMPVVAPVHRAIAAHLLEFATAAAGATEGQTPLTVAAGRGRP